MKRITVQTEDNYPIAVHHFEPEVPTGKVFVIAPGVGLPQRFFFNFASWLSEQGCSAYTFDYRGIALSKPTILKGMKASYRDWTLGDFTAVTKHVKETHSEDQLLFIGHSFGGNSLGMSTAFEAYGSFLTVGSQFGYYKHFPLKMQAVILGGFGILAPILTTLMGYFPSKWIGLGEPLPSQVMLDWGYFLLKKKSMVGLATEYGNNHYHKLTRPMLIISIDDDNFAPKKAVDILAEKVFINAATKRMHLTPSDYGLAYIGHNDFFRKRHQEQLWPIVTDWFNL